MSKLITGIHHITAICSNAQQNIDFYTGVLGLRLVKKTVNYDAPEVYHFYYGDEHGTPGTVLTFFPYAGLKHGRHGKGMLNTTAFSVPASSVDFWLARLESFGVPYKRPQERFAGEVVVYFEDSDGLGLELVFNEQDERPGRIGGPVAPEHAIRGFYSAEIWLDGYERTAGLLTGQLDHELIAEKGNRFRFAATAKPGNFVDLVCSPDSLKGLAGAGTVHHIAFCATGAEAQQEVRVRVDQRMLSPTPVLERTYFTSIYFREPGGVLFEVATAGPGFAVDESFESLGHALMLPARYESLRSDLEAKLPPVETDRRLVRPVSGGDDTGAM